jgi:hypothetical protein
VLLNDVAARAADVHLGHGPLAAAIRRVTGGPITVHMRPTRGELDAELVAPGAAMHPFLVYGAIERGLDCGQRSGCRRDRFRAGAPAGLARVFGQGRAAWIGVPLLDELLEHGPSDAPSDRSGVAAILLGAVAWTGRLR